MKFLRMLSAFGVLVSALAFGAESAIAQTGGGGGGGAGGGAPPVAAPGAGVPAAGGPVTGGANANVTNGLGGNAVGANDLLDGIGNAIPEVMIENLRQQPFVGRSIERFGLQNGGAHPRSNAETPGAGVTVGGGAGGPQFGGPGLGRGGQQLGLGQGTTNTVIRRSLRTRLVPRFTLTNPVSNTQVTARFQQRLNQMPVNFRNRPSAGGTSSSLGNGVRVQVQGRTAVLTGTVASAAERDRAERMARLEPGIYRIQNSIQVQQ